MRNLEIYSIDNTKLDKNSAQRYLPENAKIFYYPTTQRLNMQTGSTLGNIRSGLIRWSIANPPGTLLKFTNSLVKEYSLVKQNVRKEFENHKVQESQIQVPLK